MVATFAERSREIWNVNDDVKSQKNFVEMLLCKKITVILILLQSRWNWLTLKCFVLYVKATIMSKSLFAFVKTQ